MSLYVKTLKTADGTGYVLPLPAGGCSSLTFGSESGDHWIEPLTDQASDPATPTNSLICSTAGVDNAKPSVHLTALQGRDLDLSSGYSVDNVKARFTHVRIWAVSAGFVEILGA